MKPRRTGLGRKNSEYYTSGEWQRHNAAIAALGGFASGKARGIPKDLYAARQRMSTYIGTARRRKLAWGLTEERFRELVNQNCWYCGAEPAQEQKAFEGEKFNGIDRIDNTVGYVEGNVVTACARCNRAKHTMGQADFIELARRIAARHEPWSKR